MGTNLSGNGPILLFLFGSSVLFFLFASILLTSAAFFLGIPITPFHFPLAAILTFGFVLVSCFLFFSRGKGKSLIFVAGALVLTFSGSLWIGGLFYDLSYDGQAYHQEALVQLDRGWNPFGETLSNPEANHMARPLNHYSKGVWMYEAMVFKAFGEIESAKLFHFWLMLAAFSLTFSFLWSFLKLPTFFIFLISGLAAFNPVSLYQSLSFYLDGQLMSLMVALVVVLAFLYRAPSRYLFFLLFMVISVLVNVKLTAGIYGIVLVAGYLLFLRGKKRSLEGSRTLFAAAAGFAVGFLFFGFNPYLTNTLSKGNPLYPAWGTDRSEFTAPQFPANFTGRNSVSLLFFSIFARSDNVRGPAKEARLKIPFTVSREELKAFTDTNAKQGGFGPLFGGAVLLSFIIMILTALAVFRNRRRSHSLSQGAGGPNACRASESQGAPLAIPFFCLAWILFSCLINPASSLARFIPQMWLFPVFAFFLAWLQKSRAVQMIGSLVLVLLLVNNLLIGITYFQYNAQVTGIYRERLAKFAAASREEPLRFHFGHFRSSGTLRFQEHGIRYEIIEKKEDCSQGQRILPNSVILKCG